MVLLIKLYKSKQTLQNMFLWTLLNMKLILEEMISVLKKQVRKTKIKAILARFDLNFEERKLVATKFESISIVINVRT